MGNHDRGAITDIEARSSSVPVILAAAFRGYSKCRFAAHVGQTALV